MPETFDAMVNRLAQELDRSPEVVRKSLLNLQAKGLIEAPSFDHKYEPGAYGVCRRCGQEKH
jgi:predicted transcriptional regulator